MNRRRSTSSAIEMLRLSAPVCLTSFSLALMQFTDALFLGTLGYQSLAAIAGPAAIIGILSTFARSFQYGVATLVAQSAGASRLQDCGVYGWQGCYLGVAMGLAMLGLMPLAEPLLGIFGQPLPIRRLELDYFTVSLWSLLPEFVGLAIINFFYGIRKNREVMIISVSAIALNIVLSYILIFGKLGFQSRGVTGAALGTVLATTVECCFLLLLFLVHPAAASYSTRKFSLSFGRLREVARLGLPAGIQGAVDVLSWGVGLIWLISTFGPHHLAAATVLLRCMALTFLPAEGVATAVVAQVGNAIGAQKFRLANSHAKMGFRIIGSYMMVAAVGLFVFRQQIMEAFSSDELVIRIGITSMVWVALFQFFDALNINYIHALHGAGDNVWPSVANIVLSIVVLLGGGSLMIRVFPELQSPGIWMVACIYLVAQGLLFYFRWQSNAWKWMDVMRSQD